MILLAYGTRPEWIKIKILVDKLKQDREVCILYTGQQKDIGEFYYDRKVEIKDGTNRLNDIISSVLNADVFGGITHVIVQGDTASSFAVALAAFNREIPVSHIEAGLRTYDTQNPYPEESYRQMISCLATNHFCPTFTDSENLVTERKSGKKYVTGNTVIDTLPNLEVVYDEKVLVTIHRRENLPIIEEWFTAIETLATQNPKTEFILPIHPNPKIKAAAEKILKNTRVVPSMKHDDLLQLMAKCKCIISDSGGIQEEACFYRKKILVCRKVTERPAENQIMVLTPDSLMEAYVEANKNHIDDDFDPRAFGDGNASWKIQSVINELGIK